MLDNIFSGLFDTAATQVISIGDFLLCIAVSLVSGALIAAMYSFRTRTTFSFLLTLTLLPAMICLVIMMVNGNIGAGVAVAGAFSLVRFRSVPGTAKEISAIFLVMAVGLTIGMGYLAYGILFAIIIGAAFIISSFIRYSAKPSRDRTLRISIPENLDYTGIFDDLFDEHTDTHTLVSVKTSGMGSLYKLTYNITYKTPGDEKKLIDGIRCRNGNLEVSSSERETLNAEL